MTEPIVFNLAAAQEAQNRLDDGLFTDEEKAGSWSWPQCTRAGASRSTAGSRKRLSGPNGPGGWPASAATVSRVEPARRATSTGWSAARRPLGGWPKENAGITDSWRES